MNDYTKKEYIPHAERPRYVYNAEGDYRMGNRRYNKDGVRLFKIADDTYVPAQVIVLAIYNKGISDYRISNVTGVNISIVNRLRKGITIKPKERTMRPIIEMYKNVCGEEVE